MKKRLLIVTINDCRNYGNRLQNYALSVTLSRFGNVYTANCEWSSGEHTRQLFLPVISFIRKCLFLLSQIKRRTLILNKKQKKEFVAFTDQYVSDKCYSITVKDGLKPYNSINYVVLGSDQIWNYRWISSDILGLRLGSFITNGIPIISYAASFGVSQVSDDVKPIFQKYLPQLRAISVREDRGKELVKEMTGLEATVVLDPTLMLSTDQWNNITRGFVPDDDLYVLTYFLGKPSNKQEQDIQDYAKVHGCRVRRILDFRDKETYVAGPQDFVELFSKAQYVFTDSYHACCFSILYHKQFTVFNRAGMEGKANMNSRMETLFRLFDLDSVVMDKGLAPQIDYDKVDKLLAQHRAESQAWLDKAMEA